MIRVFKRRSWNRNKNYPGGYEPHVGRKMTVRHVDTEAEARRICKEHNDDRKIKTDPFMEFER